MSGNETFRASKVVILDFGSQYTQVIARRIRDCRVYSEILRFDAKPDQIRATGARGIILSGGPASVFSKRAPQIDPKVFDLGIPILGICYGLQLMAKQLGGDVEFSNRREYGASTLSVVNNSPIFDALPPRFQVWNSMVTSSPGYRTDLRRLARPRTRVLAQFNILANHCSGCNFIQKSPIRPWERISWRTF
jgi:GMP synthase (glutamine-hydrolysing) A subunit